MPRKYIKLRAKEIIPLAKELINKKDYANLVILENEIGFRKKAAKILEPTLNAIKEFLKNKNNKSIKQKQTISKAPKKETVKTRTINKENLKDQSYVESEINNIGLDIDERLEPSNEINDKEDIQIHRIRPSSNDLTDIISYPESLGTMPKINRGSKCDLAFKLMNENSIDKLLVEDDNKNILGVIEESNLFEAVIKNSFQGKINNFVNKKVKKVKNTLEFKKLLALFKKEKFVFVYKKKQFVGMITQGDLLSYIKRNSDD